MEGEYCRYRRKTNYYETDRMGIIHHSNYIRYFEEARLDWMRQLGLDYRRLEDLGIVIPVISAQCQYLVPLSFGDEIELQVRLARFDGIKMEFAYELYQSATGRLCTMGHTGHCFLDNRMKPMSVKRKFPEIFRTMQAALVRDGGTGKKGQGNRKEKGMHDL